MGTAADIVVKKSDTTTDITWSLVTASGGDKSPAVWRSNSATGTLGQRPVISLSGRWNNTGTVRRLDVTGSFPSVYTDSSTSLTAIRSKASFTCSFAFPQDMASTDISEASAQISNLIGSSMFKTAFVSGYAPT